MHRKKSDYALNKLNPDAIVYIDAEGRTDRLTREDFNSEEEFLRWKKWSDENYHEMEKKQHIEDNHTVQLSAEIELMPDRGSSNSESFGDVESLLMQCKDRLTEKQFRRYWMYRIEKLTEEEIAAREGVRQQNISKSIRAVDIIFLEYLRTKI